MKKGMTFLAAMAAVLFLTVSSATAEPVLTDILDDLYGAGNWTGDTNETEFVLPGGEYVAYGEASYASWGQEILVSPTGDASNVNSLFSYQGADFTEIGKLSGFFTLANDATVKFYDDPYDHASPVNPQWSTDPAENAPFFSDQAQTFRIIDGDYKGDIVIAFEDKNGDEADWDYNDMVVRVSGSVSATPEPGTIVLLGLGLVGLGVHSRRRKLMK